MESDIHKNIKQAIAYGLELQGYRVELEKSHVDGGRTDVVAFTEDGSQINIEVVKTNLSDLVLVRLGEKKEPSPSSDIRIRTTLIVKTGARERLKEAGLKGESYNATLLRLLEHWEKTGPAQ